MVEVKLSTEASQKTASRSVLYRLLAQGFAFPSEGLHEEVQGGRFQVHVEDAVEGLPYTVEVEGRLGRGLDLPYENFQSEYIALFEIGGPEGPPVPLYEGHYGGGLLRDMEEVLRLFHHFGFSYRGGFRPDHLQTELEFMHVLTFGEAAAAVSQEDASRYQQAQRDFLQYHLKGLAFRVEEGLKGRGSPFYPDLAQLLSAFMERDLRVLVEAQP